MENGFSVTAGVWKIEQDATTFEVRVLKYEHILASWQEERLLQWEEMHDVLLRKIFELRGEN